MKRVFVVFSICALLGVCSNILKAQEKELFVEYEDSSRAYDS
jgi:uncharacterized protein YceK